MRIVVPRPRKPEPDQSFVARLDELSRQHGSRAALAQKAGISPTTLQNYFEGSEPTRRALVALADAGAVSVSWLAGGREPKDPSAILPRGFRLFPFFDLKPSGWRIHGMAGDPAGWIPLGKSRVDYPGGSLDETVCIEAPEDLSPHIRAGDLLAIDRSRAGRPYDQAVFHLAHGALYAVAPEARILLREVRWEKVRGVNVITAMPKGPKSIRLEPFQVLGLISWRAGMINLRNVP